MNVIMKRNNSLPGLFGGVWDRDLIDNFLGDLPSQPAVNIAEKENEYTFDMAVPGVDKSDINIEINKDALTVSAKHESKKEEKDENNKIIRREFAASSFERTFTIPENVDTENIVAKQENGILKISLPKKANAPEDTVKKINVI